MSVIRSDALDTDMHGHPLLIRLYRHLVKLTLMDTPV